MAASDGVEIRKRRIKIIAAAQNALLGQPDKLRIIRFPRRGDEHQIPICCVQTVFLALHQQRRRQRFGAAFGRRQGPDAQTDDLFRRQPQSQLLGHAPLIGRHQQFQFAQRLTALRRMSDDLSRVSAQDRRAASMVSVRMGVDDRLHRHIDISHRLLPIAV